MLNFISSGQETFQLVREFPSRDQEICGVALTNGKLFVVEKLADIVQVYDIADTNDNSGRRIRVDGLCNPRDLAAAAAAAASHSYVFILDVTDMHGCKVWTIKVPRVGRPLVEKPTQLSVKAAGSLSTTSHGKLVITSNLGSLQVTVYRHHSL